MKKFCKKPRKPLHRTLLIFKWWVQPSQLVTLCSLQHKWSVCLCIYGRPGSDKCLGAMGAAPSPGAESLLPLLPSPVTSVPPQTACSAPAPLNYTSQESCNTIKCLWSLKRNPCQVTLASILGFDPSGFNQFSFSSSSLNPQRLSCQRWDIMSNHSISRAGL